MPACRICSTEFEPFIEFGPMPIANRFLAPNDLEDEPTFDLAVGLCPNCSMVQLVEQPDPQEMFHDEYAYFSSTSQGMQRHFQGFAEGVIAELPPDPFVVEVGSNDGIMLRNFADASIQHLGVEPARNVGKVAIERGVDTIFEFFGPDLADRIRSKHGPADAILAANVMCHIPDLHGVLDGVHRLLDDDGTFRFEDPYLGDILEKTAYDQIYDEHVFYFSLASVSHAARDHGLEVIDIAPQPVHGGSMRYTLAHAGAREPTPAVADLRGREQKLGLADAATYDGFARSVERSRHELLELLENLRQEGKRVVGYGATSKSTTVTNYCGITPAHVEFISDTTPIKQGKVSPGAHIPVHPPDRFHEDPPDYALLFAWNHAEEILAKEEAFAEAGGEWITYVPEVGVL